MNQHKASALLRYLAAVRARLGADVQPAARFRRHGQTRSDKPSGAQRRTQLRYGGRYRFDAKARVWRQRSGPSLAVRLWRQATGQPELPRTPRGRLSNPTALR